MVGHKYGVLRWSKTGSKYSFLVSVFLKFEVLLRKYHFLNPEKTIEGTAAGITSVLAACSILLPVLATTGYFYTQVLLSHLIIWSLL